jgi:hypothetical protein
VLFLGIAIAGYAVAMVIRRGALATAGAVAAAFGVPLTLVFLTLDLGDVFRGGNPINIDAVFIVAIIAWLIDYFFVPGLRGRTLFLGPAAIWVFWYLAAKSAGDQVATRDGAAAALVVAGFVATTNGIAVGATDIGKAGTGVLLLFTDALLAWYGAHFGRRFTTWAWGAGFALGLVLIVAELFPESYTAAGITLILFGLLAVAGAYALATATREAPDIEEVPAPAG